MNGIMSFGTAVYDCPPLKAPEGWRSPKPSGDLLRLSFFERASELVLPICAQSGRVGIHLGAEVAEDDEGFDVGGVFEGDTGAGG